MHCCWPAARVQSGDALDREGEGAVRTFVVPETGTAAQKHAYAQVLAVHAALLHTGKIVYFSGDQHDPGQQALGLFDHARLFDCTTLAVTSPTPSPTIRDLFCCGHA